MKRQFCEAQLQALLCQAETISSREAWLRMEGLLPASWQPCLKEASMATLNNRITRQKALKWIQKGLNSVEEDDMDYAEAHKDLVACTHLNMQDTATDMAKWLEILSQQMMTEDKCFVAICLGSFLPGVATAAWEKTLTALQLRGALARNNMEQIESLLAKWKSNDVPPYGESDLLEIPQQAEARIKQIVQASHDKLLSAAVAALDRLTLRFPGSAWPSIPNP